MKTKVGIYVKSKMEKYALHCKMESSEINYVNPMNYIFY